VSTNVAELLGDKLLSLSIPLSAATTARTLPWLNNFLHNDRTHHNITHTHTHPFNGPLSGTTRVSQYQKGNTNLDFSEARDSEWQWHQLGRMQVCTSLQADNRASIPPLSFLQAGCPSCRPTNSVKALKAKTTHRTASNIPGLYSVDIY